MATETEEIRGETSDDGLVIWRKFGRFLGKTSSDEDAGGLSIRFWQEICIYWFRMGSMWISPSR
jgi:hypothetical protein